MEDLKLLKELLEGIVDDLHKEILTQLRAEKNGKSIEMKDIVSFLGEIDENIIGRAKVAQGMYGDKKTRENIKEIINEINGKVKKEIDDFSKFISDKDKEEEAKGLYNKHVKNNATNKTQRQLDELESGSKKYERKDVDERLADAKKEFAEAKKIFEKSDDYDKIQKSSGKKPAELEAQFEEFENNAQVWHDSLQKVENVKKYDYVKNLDELLKLAKSNLGVDDNLVNKYKDLKKHLHDIQTGDPKDPNYIPNFLDGIDPKKASIQQIRDILKDLKAQEIEKNVPDIADNDYVKEWANDLFKDQINKSDILNLFPEDKKRIKESLMDDSIPLADKWKDIQEFADDNKKVVKDLAKTTKDKARADMFEARNKVDMLHEERYIEEEIKNPPVEPEAADTTKLDLTELGLDDKVTVKNEEGKICDFAKVEKEEDYITVVDELYDQLYSDPEAFETAKDYLKDNILAPANINIKKGTRIGNWLRKLFRKPSKEDEQMEGHIKSELKRRVDQAKAIRNESDLDMQDYNDQKTEFDRLVELSTKDKEKFNQKAAEIIVNSKGGAKAKDVMKEAENKMYEDLDK